MKASASTEDVSRRRAILLGLGAIFTLGSCGLIYPSATIRYRMTIEVKTPQGMRSGSSVIQTTTSKGMRFGDASGISYKIKGDAVAVELPDGQTLFGLLSNARIGPDYHARLFYDSIERSGSTPPLNRHYQGYEWQAQRAEARHIKPIVVLAPVDYPTLVRFRDIRDPKSVEAVDPADLAKSFGPGVKLRRITITVTDDAVTTGIEKRFGWWQSYRARHFDGTATVSEDLTTTALAAHLSSGSFSTEFKQ